MTAEATWSAPVGDPALGGTEAVSAVGEAPRTQGFATYLPRKYRRQVETQEIQVRTSARRRKLVTRSGVLAGFGLAMIVYPVMGNVVTYANSVEQVPGVIVGQTPTTGHALLGDGPSLVAANLPLPTVDDQATLMAMSAKYQVSDVLPDCLPASSYSTDNGRLPASELCSLWNPSVRLRADAALALAQLNEQFKAHFGRDMCLSAGYRTYEEQVVTKRTKGYLAATPGTSMHGYGLAFDLCSSDDSGAPFKWMSDNAGAFGFENPYWARTRKYEPWHWEYVPGTSQYYGNYDSWYADGGNDGGTDVTVEEPTSADPAPVVTPTPVVTPAPGD